MLSVRNNSTGQWQTTELDNSGDVGEYSSLAILANGDYNISYYDATNTALKYQGWIDFSWQWQPVTIFNTGDVGQFNSLDFSPNGKPFISYYNNTSKDLVVAEQDLNTQNWSDQVIDATGDVGQYTSIKIDNYGNAGISYYYVSGHDLKFAQNVVWQNNPPVVQNPIPDQILVEDFPPIQLPDLDGVFYDPDNQPLSYSAQVSTTDFFVSIDPITNIPTFFTSPNWYGIGWIKFLASDNFPNSPPAIDSIAVFVSSVNDTPKIAMNFPTNISFPEDGTYLMDLDQFVSDPDNDTTQLVWTAQVLQAMFMSEGEVGSQKKIIENKQNSKVSPSDLQINIDPVTHKATFACSADSFGVFQVKFTVADPGGLSDSLITSVTVTPVPDPPIVVNSVPDTSFLEDNCIFLDISNVFHDPDPGTSLNFTVSSNNPDIIPVIIWPNLQICNSPDSTGAANITLTATDNYNLSANDVFTVTVLPVNDPPVIFPSIPDTLFAEDDSLQIDLDDYAFDVDNPDDQLNWSASVLSAQPVLIGLEISLINESKLFEQPEVDTTDLVITIDSTTHIATMKCSGDSSGIFQVEFMVMDPQGLNDIDTIIVTVYPANDPPIASNDSTTTLEDTPDTILVLINDFDPEGDSLSINGFTQGNHGTVTSNGNKSLIYSPYLNYYGNDNFSYTVTDNHGGIDTALVFVTIFPVNDPPIAVNDTISLNEDTLITIAVLQNDSDPENDTLTADTLTHPDHGIVIINPDWTITYHPDSNFFGMDSFQYIANDGNGGLDTAMVILTIISVNDPPIAFPDSGTTDEDEIIIIPVLANDIDPEGDSLFISSISGGNHGIININPDNTVTFKPDSNYFGSDIFTYVVNDSNGGTDTSEVSITIYPVNDPPVFVGLPDSLQISPDTSLTIHLCTYVNDVDTPDSLLTFQFGVDNDSLLYSFDTTLCNLLINVDPNFGGNNLNLFITVTDDSGATASDTIHFIIIPTFIDPFSSEIPKEFVLFQNYPNPFNPITYLRFGLPISCKVKIEVYNILGQRVETLLDDYKPSGFYVVKFNASQLASGLYIYRISTPQYQKSMKMLLMK